MERRKDMALDLTIFQSINPSRFITFTFPNPNHSSQFHTLRIAVLDSPYPLNHSPPRVAAMFVPKTLETDWIFSTESGHLQLLLAIPDLSRLILVGDQPSSCSDSSSTYRRLFENREHETLERSLKPLLMALSPKSCFKRGYYEVPFLIYEDDLISGMILEKRRGSHVGEMLIEDVEIEIKSTTSSCCNIEKEFRRRLRFKRMPNLVQTSIKIVPKRNIDISSAEVGRTEFKPDVGALVHPYLKPMVAGLALITSHIDGCFRLGSRPKTLCIGVGGGALLSFLRVRLDFEVLGLEIDREVLEVAKDYFGLDEDDVLTRIHVGDGIQFLKKISSRREKEFDVIMIDLDSSDAKDGIHAPPAEFARKKVLLAAKKVLSLSGVLIVNVIPISGSFYERLIEEFRVVFPELFQIDVGNGENFVLIALPSPVAFSSDPCEGAFVERLRSVISREHVDSIKRI